MKVLEILQNGSKYQVGQNGVIDIRPLSTEHPIVRIYFENGNYEDVFSFYILKNVYQDEFDSELDEINELKF